ncbi:microfibril-associated glycoprotein 4-like [Rhagoletis pomonella]|uniref:microfibril-associated glycoprotein 4-like n=1 Tax=Rhagoletis pomonella TaxID=28610 RepID=UPI0017853D0C|nr:microfibril-associated glycoprotein 4-like [Rhagoletis pomonella]
MWLRIVYLATALLYLSGAASAFSTGMQGLEGSMQERKQDALSKFLCGVNYEKCYGQKLSSTVIVNDDKIYKTEVYELTPPASLNDILNEQNNLLTAMQHLENNLQEQEDGVRNKLQTVEDKLREQDIHTSERFNEDAESLKSELTQNLSRQKASILNILNTKIERLRKKIDKPATFDANAGLPASCADAFEKDVNAESGIYTLYVPDFDLPPFEVYCLADPNGGPAWTVVQRRTDGTEDFYRNWDDYVAGFGDKENEFFIGLEILYALTNDQPSELWIQMEDFEGEERYAKYADFEIGNESDNYTLNVLEGFSGDAGDSMSTHKGQQFSTYDRDNSKNPQLNCAYYNAGAWWYNHCLTTDSNLNGKYLYGAPSPYNEGIGWYTWHGRDYSLKYVQMAIRPKDKSH